MSTIARTIITGGYNRSSANDPGKLATDSELLEHLNRVYQRCYALVARARPDEFSGTTDLTLAGVPPHAGLPTDVIDVLDIVDATGARVNLVPMIDRNRSWQLPPCVFRRGTILVSRNTGGDPLVGDVLTVGILDAPAPLFAMTSLVDSRFPIRHVQLLVDYIACYLSAKDAGRDATEYRKIVDELKQSAAAFGAEYNLPPNAMQWLHAPVERATAGAT